MEACNSSWLASFPQLSHIHTDSWMQLLRKVKRVSLETDDMIFRNGEFCSNFFFVISGTVRVQKISSSGHEITLYRVHSGEICEITTSCVLAKDMYHAEAVAESSVVAILVPNSYFIAALKDSDVLQSYVYSNVEHGVNSLLDLLGEVAFESVDSRLAKALIKQCNSSHIVYTTHHELAANIGTAREVISRMLKKFETKGWVTLQRGKINIVDLCSLLNVTRGNK